MARASWMYHESIVHTVLKSSDRLVTSISREPSIEDCALAARSLVTKDLNRSFDLSSKLANNDNAFDSSMRVLSDVLHQLLQRFQLAVTDLHPVAVGILGQAGGHLPQLHELGESGGPDDVSFIESDDPVFEELVVDGALPGSQGNFTYFMSLGW